VEGGVGELRLEGGELYGDETQGGAAAVLEHRCFQTRAAICTIVTPHAHCWQKTGKPTTPPDAESGHSLCKLGADGVCIGLALLRRRRRLALLLLWRL